MAAPVVVGEASLAADFGSFYAATWPALAGYCLSLTGSEHVADEVAQEAFVRCYVRFPLLREPRPYVFRIATNLVKAAWREELNRRPETDAVGVTPPATGDVELLDAVRRLSAPLRDAVLLHYYADLPIEEVARVLRRPLGTVKRRLHDARKRLALDLGDPA